MAGVDDAFMSLLMNIFGRSFLDHYKQKHPAGWIDLMASFETKKRSISPDRSTTLNVSLPFSFIHFYKKHHKPLV